jgi:hypothetical protein
MAQRRSRTGLGTWPGILRSMGTRDGLPRKWIVNGGLARPLLAYIVTVTAGAWIFPSVRDVTEGRDLAGAVLAATDAFRNSLVLLAVYSLLLLPAMVLTIELVHRFEADTIAVRSLIGAASWVGWGLFGAIALVLGSRVVLMTELLVGYLSTLAVAGAVYSLLAFGGYETRPSKALIVLAVIATILAILGSIWMAGRWGGPA